MHGTSTQQPFRQIGDQAGIFHIPVNLGRHPGLDGFDNLGAELAAVFQREFVIALHFPFEIFIPFPGPLREAFAGIQVFFAAVLQVSFDICRVFAEIG